MFHELVDGEMPRTHDIWESTRFCADQATAPANIAAVLMAGMLEFGLYAGLRAYVSVSDIRMEPIMRRGGVPDTAKALEAVSRPWNLIVLAKIW